MTMEDRDESFPALLSEGAKRLLPEGGRREEYTALIKESFEQGKNLLRQSHLKGAGGREIVVGYTALADSIVVSAYKGAWERRGGLKEESEKGIALVALGGYGRGELSPFSDVDIMVLHSGRLEATVEAVGRDVFYTLWDLGLDLGNSFHSVASCLRGARGDSNLKTSLLEARLIVGDGNLYRELIYRLKKEIYEGDVGSFIRQKIKERNERYGRYEGSIYIQEPNLKESPGGLRDLHEALWAAMVRHRVKDFEGLVEEGLLSQEERKSLERAKDFLLRIRNELHFTSGRRNDILTMDVQDGVASALGYKDAPSLTALESFMRDYYLSARDINRISDAIVMECSQETSRINSIIERFRRPRIESVGDGLVSINGSLYAEGPDLFRLNPEAMMAAFGHACRLGLPISGKLKDLIQEGVGLIDEAFRRSARVREVFLEILESDSVEGHLREMHEIGFLGGYLPEFGGLTCLVQHDAYHRYTADEHTLTAIGNLRRLAEEEEGRLLADVYRQVEDRLSLTLALLLHDTGKAEGPPHAEKSVLLASRAMERMGLSEKDMEVVKFLVANHLTMSYISQQRDLGDIKVIKEFASEVGGRNRLDMLYLLTYADISAVNPDAWNEWRKTLLEELYLKALKELQGRPDEGSEASDVAKRVYVVSHSYTPRQIDDHLAKMPPDYLTSTSPERVIEHLDLAGRLGGQDAAISYHPAPGWVELVVCTSDRPLLFSNISGTLAAKNVNILGADIYTRSDGVVLDTFRVTDDHGKPITDKHRLEEIKGALEGVLSDKVHLVDLFSKRKKTLPRRKRKTSVPTEVRFDNSASESYTVIDLVAQDRVGLLFSVTFLLSNFDLGIQKAKVSTEGEVARDSIYVYGRDGGKITDERQLEEIKEMLVKVCS
jgi:[protein-PII] uridylyltransferase